MGPITIRQDQLQDAFLVLNAIPEFQNIPSPEIIHKRIDHVPHLVLTAYDGESPVGLKIGYLRDGVFYSWIGAVKPEYRQLHVAKNLAKAQEEWARENGYQKIWMKTRNCFPQMLIMAIRNGFKITRVDVRDDIHQTRITLEKSL